MAYILTRAMCFLVIIFMGWALRRIGFFKEEDFGFLSKMILRITLPAAIISGFAGKEMRVDMLFLCVMGVGFGLLYIYLGKVLNAKASAEQRAFFMLNSAGYNIGTFAMPFAQSFLGPMGVIVVSLFDVGNSLICLGGSHSIAAMEQNGDQFSVVKILKATSRSIAFDTYVTMTILALLHVRIPTPVTELAGIISNSNVFLAMLMLGVGFKLSGDSAQFGTIARILCLRYGLALVLALACYFLLPLPLEFRQALALVLFAPISSAATAYTAELKGDFGLASAINSMSIVISMVCMVCVLLIF